MNSSNLRCQNGATLVFAMIILAVTSLLAVASMRSSNLELKMAVSARDRAVAFQAAEAALALAEQSVLDANYVMDDFMCRDASSARCFNAACNNGLCFTGDLSNAVNMDDCRIAKPSTSAEQWPLKTHWANNGANLPKVQVAQVDTGDLTQLDTTPLAVPYMVEFLCFTERDSDTAYDENNRNGGVPLFRVTVKAKGAAGLSSVMLQSIFKVAG